VLRALLCVLCVRIVCLCWVLSPCGTLGSCVCGVGAVRVVCVCVRSACQRCV